MLWGGGEERQGGGEEMSTEEKCLYEYNLTLSFEETMGRWGLTNTPNVNIEVFTNILKHLATSVKHFEIQDGNAGQRRGGVDVLSSEARDECS